MSFAEPQDGSLWSLLKAHGVVPHPCIAIFRLSVLEPVTLSFSDLVSLLISPPFPSPPPRSSCQLNATVVRNRPASTILCGGAVSLVSSWYRQNVNPAPQRETCH